MSNVNDQIESRIRAFVRELHDLVRAAALDAVRVALSGSGAPATRTPSAPRVARVSGAGRRAVGGKRDPAALARTVERLRAHVAAHPGQGVEEIGKALGLTTAQLALPTKKLLAAKRITRKGVKRATRYFPAAT